MISQFSWQFSFLIIYFQMKFCLEISRGRFNCKFVALRKGKDDGPVF